MRAIPCIVLAGCFGCYTYAPSQPGRSAIGKPVRLVLTDSGARVLSPLVGAEAKTLEGRITSDTGSVYAIRVTRLMRADGLSLPRGGEKMLIPHTLVYGVSIRQFSRGRTATLLGLGTTAAVLTGTLVAHLGVRGSGSSTGGKPVPF